MGSSQGGSFCLLALWLYGVAPGAKILLQHEMNIAMLLGGGNGINCTLRLRLDVVYS